MLILILCFRNTSDYTLFSQAYFSIIAHQTVILKKYWGVWGGGGESRRKFNRGDFIKLFISGKQKIFHKLHDHTVGTLYKIQVWDTSMSFIDR